jgi:tetratricopeptide (TPR) repeat protein
MAALINRLLTAFGIGSIALSTLANPAFAGDPFRSQNPKNIGDQTEAAFKALFKEGNYPKAKTLVAQAAAKESDEPLLHVLEAALAFNEDNLNLFADAASKTSKTANKLMASDELRGNLYLAVGHFLEGAVIVKRDGLVRGAVGALGKIQEAFSKLDAAEKIDPQDPELNLIKGNIDLTLAVSIQLPLSDSTKAIQRLEGSAAPRYIADRSLAWGYRDLKEPNKAMAAVDRALALSAGNPELQYLKAQILVKQKDDKTAVTWFEKALTKRDQLPSKLVAQIERERNGAQARAGVALN